MELRTVKGGGRHPVVLLGACQGLDGEADAAADAVLDIAPRILAVALAPELVSDIAAFGESEEMAGEDEAYATGLGRWGAVTLPPPEFAAAIAAAEKIGARVEGVDMGEFEFVDLFTERVGVLALVRRAVRLRRLRRKPPKAERPEEFCRAFDAKLNRGPYAELERAREEAMSARLMALSKEGTVACLVEVQRLDGLTQALRGGWGLATSDP